MRSRPKLLLIDGNNMAHRVFWAQRKRRPDGTSSSGLSYHGKEVDLVYGFFRQLIHLHKKYPEHFRIIVWDGGYDRRLAESTRGVEAGIIPSAYKQPRRASQEEKENDPDQISLREQMQEIKFALDLVKCLQVTMQGCEADDIIYTYARTYALWDADCVVVSTDKDFMQVLDGNTIIYDAMNKEVWSEQRFKLEFGFSPRLWVDAGALMGEVGNSKDNIFGVDGWGPKTSYAYVSKYGDIDSIIAFIESKAAGERGKKEQVLLEQVPRLRLAKSLKQMDIIPEVPKPRCPPRDADAIKSFFLEWGFASLLKEVDRLVM
jgi:DNA polymerase I